MMTDRFQPRVIERWLVLLIAAHSLAVMVLLTFFPRLTIQLGGYGVVEDVFFVRQGGVFHFVVAGVYLGEYFRYGRTSSIVFAKAVAVVFLGWALLVLNAPLLVALALVGDLVMGLLAFFVRRWRLAVAER